MLTDSNYSVEKEVDKMLYKKAGIRRPKKTEVSFLNLLLMLNYTYVCSLEGRFKANCNQ